MASASSLGIASRLALGLMWMSLLACQPPQADAASALETALKELEKRTGRTFTAIVLADELDATERQLAAKVRSTVEQQQSERRGILVVPDDQVLLKDIMIAGSSAEVELQVGPSRLPPEGRQRTLDCGSSQRFELQQRSGRWEIGETNIRQC